MRVKLFLFRLVVRKPYNRPSGEGNTPPLPSASPPMGRGPKDLSSVFKYRLIIDSIDMKWYF